MLSWIERHALAVLLRQESASIKEMRPFDVPANLFSYHLSKLAQKDYIHKINRGEYALTPLGLRFAGKMSTETNQTRENMKTVIILYGKMPDGRVSLFEWSRQPYINKVTLPYDRMAYEDTLREALTRACLDKLGKIVSLQYQVSAMVTILHQGQTISRMHGLVYAFNPENIPHPYTAKNGSLFLAHPNECDDLMDGMAGFIDQLAALTDADPIEVTFKY